MPRRNDEAPVGAPCWVDLSTTDGDQARTFYTELFGWEAEEPDAEHGGYFNFRKDGVRVAGCMAGDPANAVNAWGIHLCTDDAEKTLESASANGGQVMVPAMQVGELGVMSIMNDPSGAVVGGWQPGTHKGFGIYGEPGTPAWFELHTPDYDKALDFYREVFRWETKSQSDSPEFRYTLLVVGDEELAGVMQEPSGPAYWAVYFAVDSTDAALETIARLGGTIRMPAEDTPYGRLAIATDVTGAEFRLLSR